MVGGEADNCCESDFFDCYAIECLGVGFVGDGSEFGRSIDEWVLECRAD